MTLPPYRVVVTTSDKYLPALLPLSWLMEKYWRPLPQVVVGGFTPPDFDLPENFEFVSIGKQEDYPWGKWSDAVVHLLHHHVPDEVFLLILEDMWPFEEVKTDILHVLYDYMLQFKYVLKMDICADRMFSGGADLDYSHIAFGDGERTNLVKSATTSAYLSSFMPGFWNREKLLDYLEPGWSPHESELIGTSKLQQMKDVTVLGTKEWPYRCILALRGGEHSKLLFQDPYTSDLRLSDEDVEALRELGYLEPWE